MFLSLNDRRNNVEMQDVRFIMDLVRFKGAGFNGYGCLYFLSKYKHIKVQALINIVARWYAWIFDTFCYRHRSF